VAAEDAAAEDVEAEDAEAAVAELPVLGAGVSFRPEWRWEVIRHRERLGAVEVIPETVVAESARREIAALRSAVPVLLHGISLSLGGAEGLDSARLDHFARLVDTVEPPWMSEHIAFTRAGRADIGHLAPLPFTREAVETVARNVAMLRRRVPGVPLLLENIAYTVELPGAEMSEGEFVRSVLEAADCGLLLDLENVHANSLNHGYDPVEYLHSLPLDRVVEVHLAGGAWQDSHYADTHTRPVPEESWDLLRVLARRTAIHAVIIERDDDLPPFEELLSEVERAWRCVSDATGRIAASAGE
jgi:uncharacterized protein (UPF0276 family)